MKKNINLKVKELSIAIAIVAFIMGGTYWFVNRGESDESNTSTEVILDSMIDNPQEAASTFVYLAGTIAPNDMSEDNFKRSLQDKSLMKFNENYRRVSHEKASKILAPINHVSNTYKGEMYTINLTIPEHYRVDRDSIKTSSPKNARDIQINSTTYSAVDVSISFTTTRDYYDHPRDSSWDGKTYTHMQNKLDIVDMPMTLVEIDGYWYVYDIPGVENSLGPRFSTWSSSGDYNINEDATRQIGIIK